jgi:hypothetical protein
MKLLLLLTAVICLAVPSCSDNEDYFGIGMTNLTGKMVDDLTAHNGDRQFAFGALDSGLGAATMSGIQGPIPDSVEVTWTSQDGRKHSCMVKVKPLPPPTNTSYDGKMRHIYFVIQPDNTVKFLNHDPRYNQ